MMEILYQEMVVHQYADKKLAINVQEEVLELVSLYVGTV